MRERDIFIDALEKDDLSERTAFVEQACRGDEGLRARVDRLFEVHKRPDHFFLDSPPSAFRDILEPQITEEPGVVIGPYLLLEQIGEGGMGIVFVAAQSEPLHRSVALKIVKPGMDSRQVLARFAGERQALELMDHPNIARVLDAGMTDSGRPYFVMELVRGTSITDYCDQHRLPLRQRLELFSSVCQAVQHAHQKGVIHRDIKPNNVLVAEYDGQAVPKVIDFGVAKAAAQTLSERTLFTEMGQLIGTFEYMSPEQAKLNQLDVDTRSDIYALGVLLYELVTGTLPFDGKRLHESALDEMLRIIREEDPPKPSTRLLMSSSLPLIAAHRSSDAFRLNRQVRGELDWIVMKALEKDRNRRYESANAFASDLQRYLNDEAVQACPPSHLYRVRKFARRYKAAVIVGLVTLSALLFTLVGLAGSTLLIVREQRATTVALRAETQAKTVLEETLAREQRDTYFHHITLAHSDLLVNNLGGALQLLEKCPPALRGWEWNYLTRLCRVEPLVFHVKSDVNSVAFNADGTEFATAGGDGTITSWNGETGTATDTLFAHPEFVSSVCFHPDGVHLASVGADRLVKVWDLQTRQPVFVEPCNVVHIYGAAYAVAFSPDGEQLAAGNDGSVNTWDWKQSKLLHSYSGLENHRISVAYSHDGRRLASGSWSGKVLLWDLASSSKPLLSFDAQQTPRHPVSALAFSPKDDLLAVASFDRRVDVWNTSTGKLVHELPHSGLVLCVAFSPDGRRLASSGEDKIVHIWDTATGQEVLGLRGHTGNVGCVTFSPDGLRLISGGTDGTFRVWDATPLTGREEVETRTFRDHKAEIWSLSPSPDGKQIVSGGFGTPMMVWDPQTGKVAFEYRGHKDVSFCVVWSPDGKQIACAGADDGLFTVKILDAQTGDELLTLPGAEPGGPEYFGLAYSPDGKYLVTGGAKRLVQVFDAVSGTEIASIGSHERVIRGIVFSPDGRHLASSSADGAVKLWDATRLPEPQVPLHVLRARVHGPCMNVAFSPAGDRIATGGNDNTVIIWDVDTAAELLTLRGHSGDIYTVAFSPDPDGRWIASGGEDSAVNVWDSRTGELAHSFRGHTGVVSSVAFSRDGSQLYSGSRDRTVKVWDVSHLETASEARPEQALTARVFRQLGAPAPPRVDRRN